MKRDVPDEARLTALIAQAFERLPAPDPRRLATLEARLAERVRPRCSGSTVWWWLVVALATGAAAAVWWASDYNVGQEQEPASPVVTPLAAPPAMNPPARSRPADGAESATSHEPVPKQGRVIYQRERSP